MNNMYFQKNEFPKRFQTIFSLNLHLLYVQNKLFNLINLFSLRIEKKMNERNCYPTPLSQFKSKYITVDCIVFVYSTDILTGENMLLFLFLMKPGVFLTVFVISLHFYLMQNGIFLIFIHK